MFDSNLFTNPANPVTNGLGREFMVTDEGSISPSYGLSANPTAGYSMGDAPPPTLVSAPGSSLSFELDWDSSVASAPKGFKHAIVAAAKYFATHFDAGGNAAEVININIGFGEIGGETMESDALGESQSFGYLTSYANVAGALRNEGYSFSAPNEPTSGQFFVTSGNAKTLGLTDSMSSNSDGYIGFSNLRDTGYSWDRHHGPSGSSDVTGPRQFGLQATAAHEISEVMGRIGMEGASQQGANTYTPLDLYNYASGGGGLTLSNGGGYFSPDGGRTNMGWFNNASAHGGDVADWASSLYTQAPGLTADAFDAFSSPGDYARVSDSDMWQIAALGYRFR